MDWQLPPAANCATMEGGRRTVGSAGFAGRLTAPHTPWERGLKSVMRQSASPPVYSQVAFDIAAKIASGELKEGDRFSGRSLMSSKYGVSPETIRRAISHLSDMGIVTIKNNSGSTVLSRKRAADYVGQYQASRDLLALKVKLRSMIAQRDELNEKINQTFWEISDLWERFRASDLLRTYEFQIQPGTSAEGRSIGELQFRQQTGATIVAVYQQEKLQLSPGPQTVLSAGDVLVIACEISQIGQVSQLLGQPLGGGGEGEAAPAQDL